MTKRAGILSEYFVALQTGSSAWYTHADASWLADSFRLLDSEITLYGQILASAERLEKGVLTGDATRDEATRKKRICPLPRWTKSRRCCLKSFLRRRGSNRV